MSTPRPCPMLPLCLICWDRPAVIRTSHGCWVGCVPCMRTWNQSASAGPKKRCLKCQNKFTGLYSQDGKEVHFRGVEDEEDSDSASRGGTLSPTDAELFFQEFYRTIDNRLYLGSRRIPIIVTAPRGRGSRRRRAGVSRRSSRERVEEEERNESGLAGIPVTGNFAGVLKRMRTNR